MAPTIKNDSDHSESHDTSAEEPLDMDASFHQFMARMSDASPKKPVRQVTCERPPSMESCLLPEKTGTTIGSVQAPRMPRRSLDKNDISALFQAKDELAAAPIL